MLKRLSLVLAATVISVLAFSSVAAAHSPNYGAYRTQPYVKYSYYPDYYYLPHYSGYKSYDHDYYRPVAKKTNYYYLPHYRTSNKFAYYYPSYDYGNYGTSYYDYMYWFYNF